MTGVGLLEPQSEYGLIRYRAYNLIPSRGEIFAIIRAVEIRKLLPIKNIAMSQLIGKCSTASSDPRSCFGLQAGGRTIYSRSCPSMGQLNR